MIKFSPLLNQIKEKKLIDMDNFKKICYQKQSEENQLFRKQYQDSRTFSKKQQKYKNLVSHIQIVYHQLVTYQKYIYN
ncbi:hypothetical protein TTHERM_000802399 (macronuclear) [Tetrahymena thermophila SB210]|uniref:Uncharacterized protein n=1 Tax=Tetrahymena thermophila (strain SB210) TaxID=312017 RepID=W7XF08_TETTS|nr:hypothetical protein TTHERM_000802399 [Tetrahymena thermophila SB210]EWS75353.1 hypothetical protein TTHERM_000802399 [Tetrahymena thermophila SB210]|eukprot:XP_012652113.1 hypothetical protein TTHERM_000802399 [Tetrahymena thermophila SB210]